jgi:hypothetical protein
MDMSKNKRIILIGSAILAMVALSGLAVVAFAQGEADPSPAELVPGLNLEMLDEAVGGPDAVDLAVQASPGDRPVRQFIRERMRENLAQSLGISPEALDDARWTAFVAALDDAVEESYLAQQQADRLVAQALIRQMTTRDELIAAGLGITAGEWQAAREDGKTVRQLVDELGLDATTIGQNLASFLEELIQQAADDGLISDQQAQRILDDQFLDRLARGLWRPLPRRLRPNMPRLSQ